MARIDDDSAVRRTLGGLSTRTQVWLAATFAQGALTCILVAWSVLSAENAYVRWLAAVGVVATWSLALRALRQQLVDLLALLRRAPEASRRWIERVSRRMLTASGTETVIRRLQLLAAAFSLPFFVLPLGFSIRALWLSFGSAEQEKQGLLLLSAVTFLAALLAGLYFRWAVLSLPAVAPAHRRHGWARGYRRRWNWGGTGLNQREWPR